MSAGPLSWNLDGVKSGDMSSAGTDFYNNMIKEINANQTANNIKEIKINITSEIGGSASSIEKGYHKYTSLETARRSVEQFLKSSNLDKNIKVSVTASQTNSGGSKTDISIE